MRILVLITILLSACGGPSGGSDGAAITEVAQNAAVVPSEKVSQLGFTFPDQDSDGWSVFTPSADSRIIYVSDSTGDDSSALSYTPDSAVVGQDPFLPVGQVRAFKTISAAMAAARSGFPDWVLLHRGETWSAESSQVALFIKSGRSAVERFLVSSYGSSASRPVILTGGNHGIRFWKSVRFSAVTDLHFYANQRDPNNVSFFGFGNVPDSLGFYSYTDNAESPNQSIIIENCVFDFYAGNIVQGDVLSSDIIVRRNIITNSYSELSHSQGMYAKNSSIFLAENIFDHNGWIVKSKQGNNAKSEGQATIYNHNTYFVNMKNTIFRGNIFLRGSSMGNKFTANPPGAADQVMTEDLVIENNLYVEGEIGISAGGNKDNNNGHRWKNINIRENVFLGLGRTRPTLRGLGWGVEVNDWDGGEVSGNIFARYGTADVPNIFAFSVGGHTRDVTFASNIIYGLIGNKHAIQVSGEPKSGLLFTLNEVQLGGSSMKYIDTDYESATFRNNSYYTGGASTPFEVNSSAFDFTDWQATMNTSGSLELEISYDDPNRDIESYMISLGRPGTLDAFIEGAKQQSKRNWRTEYTADAVNSYVRDGYVH